MKDPLVQLNESRAVCAAADTPEPGTRFAQAEYIRQRPVVERCRAWVCEPGVTGHTCLNPMPCAVHGTTPRKETRR